jgi:dolichol kinase
MFFVLFLSFVLQIFLMIKLKMCNNQLKVREKKKNYYDTVIKDDDSEIVQIISNNFIWGRWFLCTGLVFTNQIVFSFIVESLSMD